MYFDQDEKNISGNRTLVSSEITRKETYGDIVGMKFR